MLVISVIFFAIAALSGLVLAYMRLADKPLPTGLAVVHGLAAAVGLILLIVFQVNAPQPVPMLWLSVVLFLAAAAGGAIMFFGFHLRGKKLPVPLVILHGLLAVAGFAVLLVYLLGQRRQNVPAA